MGRQSIRTGKGGVGEFSINQTSPMPDTIYSQHGYRCRLEWGRDGARRAAARGDILVVVDVLSFSTAVVTAVHHGGIVYPCAYNETPEELARLVGGEVAVHRSELPTRGRFSLSPLSFLGMEHGTVVVLTSPNGATCSRFAREVPYLFAGALVNARTVGTAVSLLLERAEHDATIVAAGERWEEHTEDGELRVAIEDYLGAGAIISHIAASKSPEAVLCESAFQAVKERRHELMLGCSSGVELIMRGYQGDVEHAASLDLYDSVPLMRDGRFEKMIENR